MLVLFADLALVRLGLDADDEGYFVEQATRVLRGQLPYRDFDSLYTPALLYLHAAAVALLGGSPVLDVRLVGWLARVVFAVALYVICRPLARPSIAVLPSLYTLIALDRLPSTWEPHPGWPSAALSIVAVALALHRPQRRHNLTLFTMGVIAAFVFALKQNAGVMLGLALVAGITWLGLDPKHADVTQALRKVQFGLFGVLLSVTAWLLRPHATPILLAYFLGPLLAAGLAATLPVRVSSAGRTVGDWLRSLAWLGLGWTMVSAPWLVALLTALDWNVVLLKGFVGLVNQDPLWFPLKGPTSGAWASLLGIAVSLLALVCYGRRNVLRVFAALSLIGFGVCLIELTRGPDDALTTALLFAPGRASEGLSLFLPAVCMLGGVWLSARTESSRQAWWLRWMTIASAVTFLTQYPRVDEVHLTWSANLPLATGAVVLPHAYADLRRRWHAGASRYLLAVALVLVPLATGMRNIGIRGAGFVDFSSARTFPFQFATELPATGLPAAAGIVTPVRQDARLLAAARFVAANTAPDESIFVYPTSPLVYVLAGRANPTRFDHLYPGAASPADLDAVIAALEHAPVDVVVVSESDLAFWGAPLDNAPLESYLAATYHEIAEFGPYRVLRRT
jgi:hypothetical protein